MAEFVAVAAQEVAQNGNVVFTSTAVKGGIALNTGKDPALSRFVG